MITRRLALFRIASVSAGAVAAAPVAVAAVVPAQKSEPESRERFKTPIEYLLAMQAIGWTPRAMFQRLNDGTALRMGVNESAGSEEVIMETWSQFHAISMRCPVQIGDGGSGWWKEVWQFLYDRGLRQDVTPGSMARTHRDDGGEA